MMLRRKDSHHPLTILYCRIHSLLSEPLTTTDPSNALVIIGGKVLSEPSILQSREASGQSTYLLQEVTHERKKLEYTINKHHTANQYLRLGQLVIKPHRRTRSSWYNRSEHWSF